MKRLSSALLATALLVAASETASAQAGCAVPPGANAEIAGVLSKINSLRASKGLGPLRLTATLNAAAQSHACKMAATGNFTHNGSGGPKARMRAHGCRAGTTGENIAAGFRDAERTFQLWLQSPGHYRIMTMRGASHAGLAVAVPDDGGMPYWVLDLSNRC